MVGDDPLVSGNKGHRERDFTGNPTTIPGAATSEDNYSDDIGLLAVYAAAVAETH